MPPDQLTYKRKSWPHRRGAQRCRRRHAHARLRHRPVCRGRRMPVRRRRSALLAAGRRRGAAAGSRGRISPIPDRGLRRTIRHWRRSAVAELCGTCSPGAARAHSRIDVSPTSHTKGARGADNMTSCAMHTHSNS